MNSELLPAFALFFLSPLLPAQEEAVLKWNPIDNGDFSAPKVEGRIPWWIERYGYLEQSIACYEPFWETLKIRATAIQSGHFLVRAEGEWPQPIQTADFWHEGQEEHVVEAPPSGSNWQETVGDDSVVSEVPRLRISIGPPDRGLLTGAPETLLSKWISVEAEVDLPLPTEEALREEIIRALDDIFTLWFERGLDDVGPRKTGLACHRWDIGTGNRLSTGVAGMHPLFAILLKAIQAEPNNEVWNAAFDRFFADYTTLCLHPVTGLPRMWDATIDAPREKRPIEIHKALEFFLDVVQGGPSRHSQRSLEAAMLIGDTVLENGVLPNGDVAASYYAATGKPNPNVNPLRRLDVPAQLARLGMLCDEWTYSRAAREACVALEYTLVWPGNWESIDPGFDDIFGHYGERAMTMWECFPEDTVFRSIARGGAVHYAPIWKNALQLGGNIAADQVRCWEIYRDVAKLDPDLEEEFAELLRMAVRSHFKGEQYPGGAWGDVTIYRFDPKANLQVGDLPGTPQNLLHGLASVYEGKLRTEEVRAMFTAVMRSSLEEYGQEFGMLSKRRMSAGDNYNGGEIRFAVGLAEMLSKL